MIKSYEYLDGRTEIYVFGGIVFIMPVHAMVSTFGSSIVPQETRTGGIGAMSAPPFQETLCKDDSSFRNQVV